MKWLDAKEWKLVKSGSVALYDGLARASRYELDERLYLALGLRGGHQVEGSHQRVLATLYGLTVG